MKILKALVKVNHDNGGTQYIYPQIWLDNKENIPTILYPTDRSDEVDGCQIVYPVVPDDVADLLLQNEGFSVADSVELQAYSDKHYPIVDRVVDQNKVITILAKATLGAALSTEEKNALDPTNPEPGIIKTKSFIEIARDYGCEI